MKKMIKSYKFWTTLAGSIGLLVVSIGKIFGFEIAAEGIEEVIMALCGVLVVFGIVQKPKEQINIAKEVSVLENQNIQNTISDGNENQNTKSKK